MRGLGSSSNRGLAKNYLGDYEGAIEDLTKAIELNRLDIINNSKRCFRIGASRDEILPIFLKYNIEENGSIEENNTAIKKNK